MKFSKFNVVTKFEDKMLIYNLLSTSFIAVEMDKYVDLENHHYNEYQDVLSKANIIVDDNVDEEDVLNEFIASSYKNSEDDFNEIIILTTTACNARCYYCYECNLEPIVMKQDTMDNIIRYIQKNYKSGKTINLRWFGGEPLINTKAIDYICTKLSSLNISYASKMITNGSLFNEEIVRKAKDLWKLYTLQITIDGVKDDYERIKNYKSGQGAAFDTVINNIQTLIDNEINVVIRINYSVDDIERAKKIIDYLDAQFPNKKYLSAYCAALREANKPAISSFTSDNSPQLVLINYLFEHGFIHKIDRLLPKIKAFPCEAWLPKRFFLYPNGDIYKCQHTLSDNDYLPIGNVANDELNEKELAKWQNPQMPQKCNNCSCWLICRGGCKSVREQEQFSDADCYQYKNSLDGLLRLYYKLYKEVT